jgi:enoyl-[acyl-carrier protein] reductase II
MIHTNVFDLLGIDTPIIQAGMGPFTSAELAAAVSNAGGLGSIGATARSAADFQSQLGRTRDLTNRPFAANFTLAPFPPNEQAFALAIEARPRLISFAMGNPGDYARRAHDAGCLVMHQVTTRKQAEQAVACGADVIVAQGSEAGGFGGFVSGLALVPQVVDVAGSIPVVAAGGIADGRGLAAALMLGAQGINIGTRFLTSVEAPIADDWKKALLTADSEETLKFDVWHEVFPPTGGAYEVAPRILSSPFVLEWQGRLDDARSNAKELQAQIIGAISSGELGRLFPFAGQTVGMINEILPAAEITQRIVAQAEALLRQAAQILVWLSTARDSLIRGIIR